MASMTVASAARSYAPAMARSHASATSRRPICVPAQITCAPPSCSRTTDARRLLPLRPSVQLKPRALLQTRSILQSDTPRTAADSPAESVQAIEVVGLEECTPGTPASSSSAETPSWEEPHRIFLSDVVATRKRPYFLNREWTAKDIQYAVYMLVVHGMCLAAPATFSWSAFGAFVGMYIITGMFGITLSYHRHLSHKSFTLPKWLEYVFAYCGALAIQGSPMEWVSAHRFHHKHCDTEEDPHTPYEGFWWSHMGWLLDDTATSERVGVRSNIADMANDPFYNFIENTYIWHVAASVLALYALGGMPFVVWGVAVRAVWVYHITWFVNSASHVWGYQSWNTGDLSRNNWWVAVLAFGEGWHNNHHAFEYSSRHGLEWWQYDPTWYTIKLLEAVGLATKLRYPTKDHVQRLSFSAAEAQ